MEELKKILFLFIIIGILTRVITAKKITNFESAVLIIVGTISLILGCELI